MRHDAEKRVKAEAEIFTAAAKKIPGMDKTWEGQLKQYMTEFDFTQEARNVEEGVGLYDIAGNAVELCLDWAVLSDNAPSRGESVDPVGPVSRSPGASKESVRIWRGGSCLTGGMMGEDHNCRATAAYAYQGTYGCMGFRICCPAVAK
jgi:formylglycine-generating enzyme required for sulfatase activity